MSKLTLLFVCLLVVGSLGLDVQFDYDEEPLSTDPSHETDLSPPQLMSTTPSPLQSVSSTQAPILNVDVFKGMKDMFEQGSEQSDFEYEDEPDVTAINMGPLTLKEIFDQADKSEQVNLLLYKCPKTIATTSTTPSTISTSTSTTTAAPMTCPSCPRPKCPKPKPTVCPELSCPTPEPCEIVECPTCLPVVPKPECDPCPICAAPKRCICPRCKPSSVEKNENASVTMLRKFLIGNVTQLHLLRLKNKQLQLSLDQVSEEKSYNVTYANLTCPYSLFPNVNRLGFDIVTILVGIAVFIFLTFIVLSCIYYCCRSVDRCLAKNHLFHHRRSFVSTKTSSVQFPVNFPNQSASVVSNPILASTTNPFIQNPTPSRTPLATPSVTPRTKRAFFANPESQDIPSAIPLTPVNRIVTNVDKFEAAFGFPLSNEQKSELVTILMGQSTKSGPNEPNVYDLPPDNDDIDDSTFDSIRLTSAEVHQTVHHEDERYPTPPPIPVQSTPKASRPQKPPRPPAMMTPVRERIANIEALNRQQDAANP